MGTRRRTVIADAHQLWRHVLRRLIEGFGSYRVVGEAPDGRTLLEHIETMKPEILVTEVALPVLDGIRALRRLASTSGELRVLVLSEVEEPEVVCEAFAAGAMGYVSKGESIVVLRRGLRAISRGFSFLSPRIARMILRQTGQGGKPVPLIELELLRLLAKGCSDRTIASALGVGREAVNYYRLDLLRYLSRAPRASDPFA